MDKEIKSTEFRAMINAVAEFHTRFSIQNEAVPTEIPTQEAELRAALMDEENREYAVAAKNNDIVGVADALGDQLYVLLGTVLRHGLQEKIAEVFWEIHRSNLSKLGRSGEVLHRPDGKVMKGPDYFRPDISGILNSGD
jgi:predicted HAD superfamily Cof-like phosphohydrolase